jgi:hypothetical protein
MRRLCSAAAFLWVFSSGAIAADLVSVRPGLMCASKEALARLTLPNGDSRTHGPGARASDLQAAAAGGCIDIPRGARVAVQQGFRNTSVVTYSGETLVAPNIDFAPAASGGGGGAPRLTATTRLEAGDGGTLVLFEDSRITPPVQEQMWGASLDPSMRLDTTMADDVSKRPLLAARLEMLSAAGAVVASQMLGSPAATLKRAGLHGLPSPAFLLTVDLGTGMGSYAGPVTEILDPAQQKLRPIHWVDAQGTDEGEIDLPDTLKRGWQIVPSRSGGTEEIEFAAADLEKNDQWVTTYETFRFRDGVWRMTERTKAGMWENEEFPPRSAFP